MADRLTPILLLSLPFLAFGVYTLTSRQADIPRPTYTFSSFIRTLLPDAVNLELQTGIPASLTIAQAAHESRNGNSLLAKYNNLFGVKANKRWSGGRVNIPTKEYINGQYTTVDALWRVYPSWLQSLSDWSGVVSRIAGYPAPGTAASNWISRIAAGGYATDPAYAEKLTRTVARVEKEIGRIIAHG